MQRAALTVVLGSWLLAALPLTASADSPSVIAQALKQWEAGDAAGALKLLDDLLAADGNNADAHYTRGIVLDDQRQPQTAIAAFDEALRIQPLHAASHYGRGLVNLKLGRTRLSIVDFSRALNVGRDADCFNNRGLAWQQLGYESLAIADFHAAMELDEKYRSAYRGRKWAKRVEQLPDGAGEELDREFTSDKPTAEDYFLRGLARHRSGENAAALADLQEATIIDPAYAAAWNWLGVLFDTQGESGQAIDAFTKAIELRPDYAAALYGRGLARLKQRSYASAEHDFALALRFAPRDADAHNNRGIALAKLGRKEDGVVALRRAMALDSRFAAFYRDHPWAPRADVDAVLTREEYELAIERDAENLQHYLGRAVAALGAEDYDAALEDLDFIINQDAKHAPAITYRAVLQDLRGDTEGALTDFDRAIAIDPHCAKAHYGRGLLRLKRGELRQAIDDFTRAIEWAPHDADAWNNRGIAWHKLERPVLAACDFNQAMRLSPEYAKEYRTKPWAERGRGHRHATLDELDVLLTEDPDDIAARFARALLLIEHQEFAAKADLDHVIELDPLHTEAFNFRGVLHDQSGDSAGAIVDFDQAIKLDQTMAQAFYGRGLVRLKLGDYTAAEADFSRSLELSPHDADALNNRGIVRHKLQKSTAATADFRLAIGLAPRFAAAYRARDWAKVDAEMDDAALITVGFLASHSDHVEGLVARAQQYLRSGHYLAGLADCKAAIAIDEDCTRAYQTSAELWLKLGETDRAIAALTQALVQRPYDPELYFARGEAWLACTETAWAERDYQHTLALAPEHAGARQRLEASPAPRP